MHPYLFLKNTGLASPLLINTMIRPATLLFVLVSVYSKYAQAASSLPPYIKACKIGPTLEECAIKNGQAALPFLGKGNSKGKLPSIDPIEISKIEITDSNSKSVGLNITMENIKAYGMVNGKILSAKNDFENRQFSYSFAVPKVVMLFDYKANGKVLVLPVVGNGRGNITLENVIYVYNMTFKEERRKGVRHITPVTSDLTYTTTRNYLKFDNLFNGDKNLGKHMNEFMNENWEEIDKSLGPSFAQAFALFAKSVFTNLYKAVPLNELFLNSESLIL